MRIDVEFPVLDKGFVRLVDAMGDDGSIVQAARVSYGAGTKQKSDDEGLIRYLMRNNHSTPFEMCVLKVHVKAPLFVVAQWVRHRASSFNMLSYRYSEAKDEFYIPTAWRKQSSKNKQASEETAELEHENLSQALELHGRHSLNLYRRLLEGGVAREMARMVLPQNLYTEFYWKIDLRNLLHFIELRRHSHAQVEIQVYAQALEEIVKDWVPVAWKAFDDYRLKSVPVHAGVGRPLIESLAMGSLAPMTYVPVKEFNAFLMDLESRFGDGP